MKNEDYPGLDHESVLVKPFCDIPTLGLVLYIHDGPHSCYVSKFDYIVAGFTLLGFAVLCPNYRGSMGLVKITFFHC